MNNYVVLDIETTGISPEMEYITEIGAALVTDGQVTATFNELVKPGKAIPPKIVALTGITDEMVAEAPSIEEVMPLFVEFCGDHPILGHNVAFDYSFLKTNAMKQKLPFEKHGLDTLVLARQLLTDQRSYSLTSLIGSLRIERTNAHRGLDDALATHELYQLMYRRYFNDFNEKLFQPKPFFYKPKKQSPITLKQVKFLSDLVRRYRVEIDYDIEKLTKSEASRKIDHILHEYGRKMD